MMVMSFNEYNQNYFPKNKATSIFKSQQTFSSLSSNDVGNNLRDGTISNDIGLVSLHCV